MNKLLSLSFFFLVCGISVTFGQFTSVTDGNWNDGATWGNTSPGTAGVDYPASATQDATVGSNVTVPASFAATVRDLYIQAGFLVTIANTGSVALNGVLTIEDDGLGGNGILDIFGNLRANQGSSFSGDTPTSVIVRSTGRYTHNFTTSAGSLLQADWTSGSTCEVIGYTTNATRPTNLGQSFYHFIWNCPNGAAPALFIGLNGELTTVGGDFTVTATGGGTRTLRLFDTTSGNTMTVGGNVLLNGSSRLVLATTGNNNNLIVSGNFTISNTATSQHTITTAGTSNVISVTGNFLLNSTAATTVAMATLATGSSTLNITGNFTLSPTAASIVNMSSTITNVGAINLHGNFSLNSNSTLSSTATAGSNLTFNGTTAQTFSNAGTISTRINYRINNGSTLDLQTSALIGTGTFNLAAGGTVMVGSPDGLRTGTTQGNIRVSGARTYTANGNIIYNGTTQNLGNEWTSGGGLNGVAVNLEIVNGSVVTNNNVGSTSLVGILSLTNGRLNIGGSNALTIQGIFNSTASGFIGGSSSSNLTFSGSGATGTLNFASGAEALDVFTVGRTGTLVLGTNLTVNSINLSFGNLNFSGRSLTVEGASISSAGTGLISSNTSNLSFGGSSFSGTIPFSGAGNQLNNLTFSTPGGVFNWNSNVTIVGNVTLTAGTINHSSGLTMGTNSTFIRSGGSVLLNEPDVVTSYNVTYTGAVTTGLELPASTTELNNLTVNSSGPVALDKNITVNGNVLLSASQLQAVTRNITLASPSGTWTRTSGSFSGGTGIVIVTGTYSIIAPTSTPNYTNLNVTSTGSLTLPSGSVNISGNFQVNAAGTLNANNGTVILNGSGNQSLSMGGKILRNVSVNKSGGNVTLVNAVSITGLLNIQTASAVVSSGNLTLVSNASGTATVGDLSAGGSITGNVIVQRYIAGTGRDYRDISPQVQNPTVSQVIASGITITGPFTGTSFPCGGCATNNASFFFYNESVAGLQANGYVGHPANGGNSTTAQLTTGRGYNLLVRNELGSPTMNLTGVINSGNLSLPVTYTSTAGGASEDGWNFVGNPYPSPVDWDDLAGWTKTAIQGNQISVWDPQKGANGGYRIWNGSTGDLGNGRIAAGQGFWIKASSAPTLDINEGAKVTTATSFYRKKEGEEHFLELVMQGNGVEDQTYIQLNEEARRTLDVFDGFKLPFIEGTSIATVSPDNFKLAINVINQISDRETFPLSIDKLEPGSYLFSVKTAGEFGNVFVSLMDSFTGTLHDFTTNEPYEFTVTEASLQSTNRFVLIIGREQIVTGLESRDITVSLFPNPVESQFTVQVISQDIPSAVIMDSMGKSIGEVLFKIGSNGKTWTGEFDMRTEGAGVYFIKAKTSYGNQVVKFLKK